MEFFPLGTVADAGYTDETTEESSQGMTIVVVLCIVAFAIFVVGFLWSKDTSEEQLEQTTESDSFFWKVTTNSAVQHKRIQL